MRPDLAPDEALVQRLPLPLAQLYRRAHNAKTALERYLTAYYLWEASLKLLASAAVIEYAEMGEHDAQLAERLRRLARPALGHWWKLVRALVPVLAERGNGAYVQVRDVLLGKARDDLPRAAGLDAVLREVLEGKAGSRTTVVLRELFDRLVQLRNEELGHGAAGQRPGEHYHRLGPALLVGVGEVLGRLDVLPGRQLVHVADVRRLALGNWLVERYELTGEAARRLESLEVPEAEAARLPRPGRLYLQGPEPAGTVWPALHPLAVYDAEAAQVSFLTGRRGQRAADYLCYTTGEVVRRDELGQEQRELLARVLGGQVDEGALAAWAERSRTEEPALVVEPPAPRRTLGEFELISRLGQGGMGVVYRAWQPSLGRQVALKALLRTGDPKAEARFAREIRALGKVEHPNLVKVFTSGADGEQWFYAMELVEGADLGAICTRLAGSTASDVSEADWTAAVSRACIEQRQQEHPLSGEARASQGREPPEDAPGAHAPGSPQVGGHSYIARVVEVMRQAAEAANALHEAGVIHRDIKPGNILLSADGRHAVLMDLGLAQLADETAGRLTQTRHFVGTLRYASPEQLGGAGLDRRADVYSLGATLWELLTLRPLFGVAEQTPTPDLILRIQQAQPEGARKYNPRVPADLEAIVQKCLAKERERRYATAADLGADLGRWQRGEPVLAQPPSVGYLLGIWVRQNLGAAGRTVLLGLGLGLWLGVATWAGFIQTYWAPRSERTYQDFPSLHQPWLLPSWRMPAWLVIALLLLSYAALAGLGLSVVAFVRPRNRTADLAAGSVAGLAAAVTWFSLSLGWVSVVATTWGGVSEDLRWACEAARAENGPGPGGPRQAANADPAGDAVAATKLLQKYPDLKDVAPGRRAGVLSTKILSDGYATMPVGIWLGMLIALAFCGISGVGATLVAGGLLRRCRSMRKLGLGYVEGTLPGLALGSGGLWLLLEFLERNSVSDQTIGPNILIIQMVACLGGILLVCALEGLVVAGVLCAWHWIIRVVVHAAWIGAFLFATLYVPGHPQVSQPVTVGQRPEEQLNNAAWEVVRAPGAGHEAYAMALRQAEAAVRAAPDDRYYLNTLGVAQYRVGDYAKALETLDQSEKLNATRDGAAPCDLAFLAMAHRQLGHKEQARATLARLRDVMKQPLWRGDPEAPGFLREAEELVEGKPGAP
jgi:serine/threonine protein kinase